MSYPTLQINSDANQFRVQSHSSLLLPPYASPPHYVGGTISGEGGPLADTCRADCGSNSVPPLFQRLGQRNACCASQTPSVKSTVLWSEPSTLQQVKTALGQSKRFPGYSLPLSAVDNLSTSFCQYDRNARYVGQFGGVPYGNVV